MPNDSALKVANFIHRGLLRISGGRLASTLAKMPVLELITTGRKSGRPRSVMLTAPIQDDDTLVLVASRGGDDHHPAWFLNLRDNPDVRVKMNGETRCTTARIATAAQRAELWPRITDAHTGYGDYQDRTDREIPVVLVDWVN